MKAGLVFSLVWLQIYLLAPNLPPLFQASVSRFSTKLSRPKKEARPGPKVEAVKAVIDKIVTDKQKENEEARKKKEASWLCTCVCAAEAAEVYVCVQQTHPKLSYAGFIFMRSKYVYSSL